jgi:hypothetical protein
VQHQGDTQQSCCQLTCHQCVGVCTEMYAALVPLGRVVPKQHTCLGTTLPSSKHQRWCVNAVKSQAGHTKGPKECRSKQG